MLLGRMRATVLADDWLARLRVPEAGPARATALHFLSGGAVLALGFRSRARF